MVIFNNNSNFPPEAKQSILKIIRQKLFGMLFHFLLTLEMQ